MVPQIPAEPEVVPAEDVLAETPTTDTPATPSTAAGTSATGTDGAPSTDPRGAEPTPDDVGLEPRGPRTQVNPTTLAAGAPAKAGAAREFTLRAGYNVPTPDPFARNRQRVGRSFGEVLVSEGVLLLRLRRKRVGRLLPPLRVLPEEIRLVSPTETDFMGNNRGIVLERQDGEHLYVWVDEPVPLLTVLSIQGFPVGQDPVPVSRAG